mmetsp:Transcript_76101/g.219813  ORF Transcript_76101/g.219813 Transcript_76101/m.219813 type:complete len:416 (-) Transcript_76101:79-1326(-)
MAAVGRPPAMWGPPAQFAPAALGQPPYAPAAYGGPWQRFGGPQMMRPRPPAVIPPNMPLCPDIELPPQPLMDSAFEDGPISVAYGLQVSAGGIRPQRPCPATAQYVHRGAARRWEQQTAHQPRPTADICGWVLATVNPGVNEERDDDDGAPPPEADVNEFRLVFQCISGWTLMLWRSQEEFEEGIHGHRRAPRAVAWFDLRNAFDVHVESGDPTSHLAANRVTVMMRTGSFYFCVELPEDVPIWYEGIRRVIQDYDWQRIRLRDTDLHRRKRWPAARGIVDALFVRGSPVAERAMAILFHAYDIDYDCCMRVGEFMVLLQELIAALVHRAGLAEAADRDEAVASAASRVSEDELFDRAMVVRRRLCREDDGKVRKDEFVLQGVAAIIEALASLGFVADAAGGDGSGGGSTFGFWD